MRSLANLTCALPLAAALLAAPVAEAGTVIFSGPGTAAGVAGLVVGGTTYNVSFTGAPSGLDWAAMLPFSTEAAAMQAATALAAALTSAGATEGEGTGSTSAFTATFFQTFYGSGTATDTDNTSPSFGQDYDSLLGAYILFTGSDWITGLANDFPRSDSAFPFAVQWTVAAIPLPATLPLVLLALGGLGLAARRRKS